MDQWDNHSAVEAGHGHVRRECCKESGAPVLWSWQFPGVLAEETGEKSRMLPGGLPHLQQCEGG